MKRFTVFWLGLCLVFIGAQIGASEDNRIVGEPVDSNVINRNSYSSVEPKLVLKQNDHLGARVDLCKDNSDNPCDEMDFLFPQLRLDRAKKLVFSGNTPVATYRSWGGTY
jgi:hypothetical protein